MSRNNLTRKELIIATLVFLSITIIGAMYIRYTWVTCMNETSKQALKTAETAETALDGEMVKKLRGVPEDTGTVAYESIKKRLLEIRSVQDEVRFVYIYALREDKIYFMADSEPVDSKDYSPPGQEYTEANYEDKKIFDDQKAIITKPTTDRWGTWVSIQVPMIDFKTGKVIAVFGMDYPADKWNIEASSKTLQAAVIVAFLLLLVILSYIILNKNIKLRKEKSLSDIAKEALVFGNIILRSQQETTIDGILIVDEKGKITSFNQHFIDMWGIPPDIIESKSDERALRSVMDKLVDPEEFISKVNYLYKVRDEKCSDEITLKDGRFFDRYSAPMFGDDKNYYGRVWYFRDITERKEAEENLKSYTDQIELKNIELDSALTKAEEAKAKAREMAEQAEMANKAKSTFLANMSHEIRTPLNAIIGFSQLMNRDPQITDSQKDYIISIIRAGEHLLALINDILELSKVEAGRAVLNLTNVDFHSLFSDIHLIFKEQAQAKHLQFIFEIADNLHSYVLVDENKLRQIFINLIGNAIKFTDEGGVAVRARIDKDNEDTYKLIVEVEDSGPGIPENEINNLFKHFVQTSSGMNKGSGTGLGLVLSRELAILMGGDITVSSQVGKGSVFTFNVKIKKGGKEIVETNIPKRVISIDKGKEACRVLVVDDKKENLQVAVNLLKLVGFETIEAVNGEDAITKFEECKPDLILMDMRMPVMDGYEATRRIKLTEEGKLTPIIALTASAFEEERKEIKSLDMQGYLRKPFRENDLFNLIGKVLDLKYIYEDEKPLSHTKYINDEEAITENIAKLTDSLVLEMSYAVSVADFDQLMKLINSIDPVYSELAQHLMTLAKSYDYNHLQQILLPISL
ncbi:MAG: ATP-binding protein [Bacteroidota bacterium]